ncbi:hypothetical protein F5Y03DRAFT_375553 [Xylaria venustula]|nr:hypothetical protein F5Y03DRAFT_375553 [Xylaria venustula]
MTSPQATNFLSIPTEIRRDIYHAAGLISGCRVPIVSTKYKPSKQRWPFSKAPGLTYNLLQVSKEVNREVGILICAHNTFRLLYEDIDYGLAFLRSLDPLQCAALKSLSIHLYRKSQSQWQGRPASPADPFWKPVPEARLVLWLSAARHLLSNTYQTLAVQLFCHTGAKSITYALLQPFLEYPGHLKDLEVELDCEKGANHPELRSLAWRTVCHAKGEDASLSFPFFTLPIEIRHHILTYTDLVTPFSEIYWNAKSGFNIISKARLGSDFFLRHYPQIYSFFSCIDNKSPAIDFKCCGVEHEWSLRCSVADHVCCQSRTGYSSRCRCWTNPRALLVVNRQLYHEAIQVLYSYNRVIVVPSVDFRNAISPIKKRLDAAVFITRHMWPEVLNYLRDFECVFPCIDPSSLDLAQNPYSLDLCFAMDHLASNACMGALHVTVYLTTAGSVRKDDVNWFHYQLLKHNAATALRAHSHFLSTFRSMKGIKDFFVKLEWGWRFHVEQLDWRYELDDEEEYGVIDNDEIDMLELSLEKMIMGREYAPGLARKLGRKPSVWPFLVYNRLEYSDWPSSLSQIDIGYI